MVDRRRIARTRISTPALVIANGGSLVRKCLVRDIASLGARLEFQDAPLLPTAFNLTFDGKTLRRCHVKWRIANEVGVSFSRLEKDPTQR
jgi:PilZ domain